jgi:hypothetical protein
MPDERIYDEVRELTKSPLPPGYAASHEAPAVPAGTPAPQEPAGPRKPLDYRVFLLIGFAVLAAVVGFLALKGKGG